MSNVNNSGNRNFSNWPTGQSTQTPQTAGAANIPGAQPPVQDNAAHAGAGDGRPGLRYFMHTPEQFLFNEALGQIPGLADFPLTGTHEYLSGEDFYDSADHRWDEYQLPPYASSFDVPDEQLFPKPDPVVTNRPLRDNPADQRFGNNDGFTYPAMWRDGSNDDNNSFQSFDAGSQSFDFPARPETSCSGFASGDGSYYAGQPEHPYYGAPLQQFSPGSGSGYPGSFLNAIPSHSPMPAAFTGSSINIFGNVTLNATPANIGAYSNAFTPPCGDSNAQPQSRPITPPGLHAWTQAPNINIYGNVTLGSSISPLAMNAGGPSGHDAPADGPGARLPIFSEHIEGSSSGRDPLISASQLQFNNPPLPGNKGAGAPESGANLRKRKADNSTNFLPSDGPEGPSKEARSAYDYASNSDPMPSVSTPWRWTPKAHRKAGVVYMSGQPPKPLRLSNVNNPGSNLATSIPDVSSSEDDDSPTTSPKSPGEEASHFETQTMPGFAYFLDEPPKPLRLLRNNPGSKATAGSRDPATASAHYPEQPDRPTSNAGGTGAGNRLANGPVAGGLGRGKIRPEDIPDDPAQIEGFERLSTTAQAEVRKRAPLIRDNKAGRHDSYHFSPSEKQAVGFFLNKVDTSQARIGKAFGKRISFIARARKPSGKIAETFRAPATKSVDPREEERRRAASLAKLESALGGDPAARAYAQRIIECPEGQYLGYNGSFSGHEKGAIFALYKSGMFAACEIARKIGVDEDRIGNILRDKFS